MSYQVVYPGNQEKQPKKSVPFALMLCGWLLAFVILTVFFWPEGAQVMQKLLLPGDTAVTAAALEDFAAELQAGEQLSGALENFCRSILENEELGLH
ncbi:MAG TPA: hypothetical protein IAB83_04145 [Candidatus Faecousia faecavium]|nr:hypothetical protein [Candidatus Faecousia faecavium]